MSANDVNSAIHVETKYLSSEDSTLPALAVQVTRLIDSYMLWIGVTEETPEDVHKAPLQGSLARDFACAMPPVKLGTQASGTSLFSSPNADFALSMAQRLGTRFKKQVFLSVDVPPTVLSTGQAPKLLLAIEKGLVGVMKELENSEPLQR